ncbi:hypothetical protein C8R45DRAFT_1166001 [Mycena sanguinolenta]|nr:hypothetical protein C8R45DRAFT_1166001 [Mycena sanguinolenta]
MPRQPTVTEIRLENLTACLTPAVTLLTELNDAFSPAFVQPISNTVASLLKLIQNVKQNKKECAELLENVHQVLFAIINLHIKSEAAGSLSPAMTEHVGRFMKTLQKIYIYIEAQQDRNKLKQLFRSIEMNNLVKGCHEELDEAKKTFEVATAGVVFKDIKEMQKATETKHKELLELISTMSEVNTTTDGSSVHLGANELKNSSNSFSLLPSKPKIFHGRETEVESIMKILRQQPPRIAILGGGGMGKTSLARAVLHSPETSVKFEERYFVSAEAATTSIELAALIGLHIGLNPGKDLTKPVVQYFSRQPTCLLILDNLETVWEPIQSRGEVEEFLSLLTGIQHLGLIITMRGAERPAKVQWTHPFLSPLKPMSDAAAQQTFLDITDNAYAIEDLHQLLSFTDNMPLAVDLISHLVDYEGLENVLGRWETDKTSILSVGYDRKSNLDASIDLSLSSPRLSSESKELLSLLSILPNGLSDVELVQSKLPIPNILSCKAVLLATSLAYQNSNKRLLVLVPVREHIQQVLPPPSLLIHSLCRYFRALLKLYREYNGEQLHNVVSQITINLGNMQEVLKRGLSLTNESNLEHTIYCVISLNSFYRITNAGVTSLMDQIQHVLARTSDPQLKANFLSEAVQSQEYFCRTTWIEELIVQGISYFKQFDSLWWYQDNSILELQDFTILKQIAQELSKSSGNCVQQGSAWIRMAQYKLSIGDYSTARLFAIEAQQAAEETTDLYQMARAFFIQALCARSLGDYKLSAMYGHSARKLLEICGLSQGYNAQLITENQAEIHLLKSEYSQAQSIFRDMANMISLNQKGALYANALLNITYIDIQVNIPAEIVWRGLNRATEIFSALGFHPDIVLCKTVKANIELREHNFDLAEMHFQECLHINQGLTALIESFCLENLANIRAWPAKRPQSRWPMVYLTFSSRSKDKLALHKALLFLGDMFLIGNDENTAFTLYTVALEGFTYMDVHQSRAQCMLRLGDLAHRNGNTAVAAVHWTTARPLFERSSQAKDIIEIDSRLAALEKAHEEALDKLAILEAPTQLFSEGSISEEDSPKVILV